MKEPFVLGIRVRHYGTKRWGKIIRIVPQGDGTFEYEIERDLPLLSMEFPTVWWASYHIDRSEHKFVLHRGEFSGEFQFCNQCGRQQRNPMHVGYSSER